MTETGEYTVLIFNRKGGRLRDLTGAASSLMAAKEAGNAILADPEVAYLTPPSFRIDRAIFNSLDDNTWS